MTKPNFTSRQRDQLKEALALDMARKAVNYDRSADGKAWLFYPCDDHVIRVSGDARHGWTATLTKMADRTTALSIRCGETRKEAVNLVLMAVA